MTKPCVLCKKEFEEKDLDFTGRCDQCFHFYMSLTEDEKAKLKGQLGVPFTPGYNSTWKK